MAATRHEVTRLHAIHIHTQMRHGWLKHVVDGLETDPHVQYKVHLYGVVYWLINFPLIAAFFFLYPTAWLKWGVFITLIYSIYANFATDYGAMSAAMAAFGDHPLPEIPVEAHIPAKGTDNK
jgi:hypothetical protein